MKVTIDRFEGNFALLEIQKGNLVNVPKSLIPSGAKEGDVLKIEIDKSETNKQSQVTQKLMDELWAD